MTLGIFAVAESLTFTFVFSIINNNNAVLRWVTVSGSIPGAGHLFQYVTNQPPKANSAFHPSAVGK